VVPENLRIADVATEGVDRAVLKLKHLYPSI
jgi:hypothetical protein